MPRAGERGSSFFSTLMEVGHGQEESEESEEGGEEEEESGRAKGGGEAGQENRQEEGGEESARAQESGRPEAAEAGDADGGAADAGDRERGAGSFHGGDAGGEDGTESRRGLAVSDGLEALNAARMTCGGSGAHAPDCTADIRERAGKNRPERSSSR
jgi:hypothetical protein